MNVISAGNQYKNFNCQNSPFRIMEESKIILSIIIVTYKSDSYIDNCLNSINQYNDLGDALEIIIVDNSPKEDADRIFTHIRKTYSSDITLIHNSKNGGYGQGNNLGIAKAKGKYICVMNPDIELIMPIFSEMVNELESNPKLAMVGGNQKGRRDLSFYIRQEYEVPLIMPYLTVLINKRKLYWERFMFLSGALLFINKKHFEDIGLFDENLFLYSEESDVTLRFLRKNYHTKFRKDLVYKHLIDERKELSNNTFEELLKSNYYYFKKYNFNINRFINKKIISFKFLYYLTAFKSKSKAQKYKNYYQIYENSKHNRK